MDYLNDKTQNNFHNDGTEKYSIETVSVKKGQVWKLNLKESQVVIVKEGQLSCSFAHFEDEMVCTGNFFLVPAKSDFIAKILEDSTFFTISIGNKLHLYSNFSIENLRNEDDEKSKDPAFFVLSLNKMMTDFLHLLDIYLRNGMNSQDLMEIKTTEFFYILSNFYEKKDVQSFMELYLTDDFHFREQIYLCFRKVRTVQQLAEQTHYSYSGFNKRFKKVFGVSAYSWMQTQRAQMILQELSTTNKSLKEISIDYSFVSLSHFNGFCHKELGSSPSEIRKKNLVG
ncbi:helix-turn-helix transcriptional regulator [Dysgonomonas sp. 520]|uniref:helix-turn-helix transcriptional regulator n=1 Tax=Dysgonomonas sp. 520 TaxID=2302931 RepID=UPI0013D80EE5|nr:helix-turn-helix transcriptional regulator [Dysgonomonas sp. 520]NDW09970.1 AraC family transcriptional regulator [Dysgonomonas sp. 520]